MYVARFTNNPETDIKRGWSGFMGVTFDSMYEAARSLLVNGDMNLDEEEISDKSDDELSEMLDDNNFDVRFDDEIQKFRHVHHDGLSCWRLYAEDVDSAVEEAQNANIVWGDFGQYTVGKVTLVCAVPNAKNLYIFECETAFNE